MNDWPFRNMPVAAWCPTPGREELLAVPLLTNQTVATWREYRQLLGCRVDWLAKREPDALDILMSVFDSYRHVWLTVSGIRQREWAGTHLMEDDLVGDTLIALVGRPLPGKVESNSEAVAAIKGVDLETWAMLLRSELCSGGLD
jgi:hypothetical protein